MKSHYGWIILAVVFGLMYVYLGQWIITDSCALLFSLCYDVWLWSCFVFRLQPNSKINCLSWRVKQKESFLKSAFTGLTVGLCLWEKATMTFVRCTFMKMSFLSYLCERGSAVRSVSGSCFWFVYFLVNKTEYFMDVWMFRDNRLDSFATVGGAASFQ